MARESWTGRIGFVLAAVGSAVGLGNLWRFPWMTAENGGSAFLVVYLGIVIAVGVPGLLAEFVLGRRSRKSPVGALRDLSGSRNWGHVGLLSVLAGLVLLSFYSVVGGWILRYLVASPSGAYFDAPGAYFDAIAHGPAAAAFHVAFLAATAGVVYGGVRDGIERATTIMMPVVALVLVGMAAWASGLGGAGDAYAFYLAFDLATIRANALDVVLAAAGQALFTLSVGAGTMITYASYVGEDRSLPADATLVAVLNTSLGVLAGLVVFPLLFSTPGVDVATSGPGALFVGVAAFVLVTGGASAFSPSLFGALAGPVVDVVLTTGLLAFVLFAAWVVGADAVAEFARGTRYATGLGGAWRALIGVVLPPFLLFTLGVGILDVGGVDAPTWQVAVAAVAVAAALVAGLVGRSPTAPTDP